MSSKLCFHILFSSYFINHYTKATTWEDPRVRYQQIGKPVSSSAASTSSKENTRHGGTTSYEQSTSGGGASGSDGTPFQVCIYIVVYHPRNIVWFLKQKDKLGIWISYQLGLVLTNPA